MSEPTPTPTPTIEADAIRGFDFTNVEWSSQAGWRPDDAIRVPIANGTYVESGDMGPSSWSVDPAFAVFADADGDGYEDALVRLDNSEGNGYSETYYLWRWDPQAGTATQVADPVAQSARCGHIVTSVTPAEGGFAISELRRDQDSMAPCAEAPTVVVDRVVGYPQGHLTMISPQRGYGGVCPWVQYGDPPPDGSNIDGVLRVGPDAAAPVAVDNAAVTLFYPESTEGMMEPPMTGPYLVAFSTAADPWPISRQAWPCGFIDGMVWSDQDW